MVAQLTALRDPKGIPPFTRIEALQRLVKDHRLRPTDVSFLYRLAGSPKRLRWKFRLVPELTDREREAIDRVERLMAVIPTVPLARFENPEGDREPEK
jgi:hypothetical protein